MVSPSSTLSLPARSNQSFQLILGQSLACQDTALFGSFCLLGGFVISVPCLPSHHNAQRGNHCQILPLHHLLPPGNLRDHEIAEISANGMGSPLYRLAALPKISLAQLLLSSEKKTTVSLLGRKWGKDVGREETYEGEKKLSPGLDQGHGLPKSWEHWDPGSQFRPSFNAKIWHTMYFSSAVPLLQLRVSGW